MKTFVVLAALLGATVAYAATLEDFEGVYSGAGTLVADPDNAANTCLALGMVDNGEGYYLADVYALDVSGLGGAGVVTMDIYDYGKYFDGNRDGARWGVEGDLNSVAVGLLEKSWLGSEAGYAFNTSGYDNQTTSGIRVGSWYSALYLGEPREVDALDSDATLDVVGADGAWTTWSFTVDASGYITEISRGGAVVMDVSTVIASAADGGRHLGLLTTIWASASRNNAFGLDGLLIDNVTFTVPEPATLSMLALGGLALIRRRR